jgi:arylsulfatase A-like enzyme
VNTASKRPNIVLLILDALRADAVEGYGAPLGATPALGQLGGSGVAVSDVRSTASWTLPAHTAFLTGQLARGLGLGQAPNQVPQGAAPVIQAQRSQLLPEVLRQHGYAASGLSANGWAGRLCSFDTGFETFLDLDSARQNDLGGGLRNRLRWDWEELRAKTDDGAMQASQVLARWISEVGDSPFFWFMNIVECHSPYLPPKPHAFRSPAARLRAADEAFRYLTFESILRANLGNLEVPPAVVERMRRMYRASVRYVDSWLGDLLERLDDASLLDETLVIVCSDHGENFGVSGLMGHGVSLDDRLLRVPFIVSGPNFQAFEGMRSLLEVPARIAAAVGISDHPWPNRLSTGLPVAQWDPFELSEERLAGLVRDWSLDQKAISRLTSPLTCAVAGDFKLVRGATKDDEWLFDLKNDPLELAPIRGQEKMSATVGELLGGLRAAVNHPLAQATAEVTVSPPLVSDDEVADIERKMRLMGYM